MLSVKLPLGQKQILLNKIEIRVVIHYHRSIIWHHWSPHIRGSFWPHGRARTHRWARESSSGVHTHTQHWRRTLVTSGGWAKGIYAKQSVLRAVLSWFSKH